VYCTLEHEHSSHEEQALVFFLLANSTEYNGKEPIQEKKIMRNHVPVGFLE